MTTQILVLLICNLGGAGTADQAGPVVAKFLRHFEQSGGWSANTLRGVYETEAAGCAAAYRRDTPKLLVADLPTYLAQRRAWGLRPLAHLGPAQSQRYYLLVRSGGPRSLAALAKQPIVSLLSDARFIARIVLGGKLREQELLLRPMTRPLQGLRALARGQATAALVDEATYRYLDQLQLEAKLESIYASPELPGLTLLLSGKDRGHALEGRVRRALPQLCRGAGAELCKTFAVPAFVAAVPATLRRFEAAYR
ncbi:MAG: hypothetical protein IPL40_07405 [Proteobacteria bacterium]|nr:hypothetical protein [Pseudomonadota bacterium]